MTEQPQRRRPPQEKKRRTIGRRGAVEDHTPPVSPLAHTTWEEAKQHQDLDEAPGTSQETFESPDTTPAFTEADLPAIAENARKAVFAAAPQFAVSSKTHPKDRLADYENIIDEARNVVDDVAKRMRNYVGATIGMALLQIRAEGLVANLEAHAKERWDYARQHLYRMMDLGLVVNTWPDLEVDWSYRQAAVMAGLIKDQAVGPDKARAIWEKAVETGDTSERGLKTAQAMLGLGAEKDDGKVLTGVVAPARVQSAFRRYQSAADAAVKAAQQFKLRTDGDRRKLAQVAQHYPEGAAGLVLDMQDVVETYRAALNELASDVDEEQLAELRARRALEPKPQ
ncbi:hypothetical protein AB0K18_43165 [Nonomuraea sp. NPDC049421]|uniref:hypothetical protein n=1 Tax=Nonomuraea sp. NPDC049421 TaxID=3155275 RepID=UPI0034368512